jgi:hypothetical protein
MAKSEQDRNRRRFEEALREKEAEARERSREAAAEAEEEQIMREAPQDELDNRAKSSGHGKKTADKWNQ